MIRRSVFSAAAAAALILVPGTALAQPGQPLQPSPPPGQSQQGEQDGPGHHRHHGHHGHHCHHRHHGHHCYEAEGFEVTASDPTPEVDSPETVVLHGAQANEKVTLTITSPKQSRGRDIEIAGTKALVKTANASGVATFTVSLAAAGVYPMTMTSASGELLGTNTLMVVNASPASAAPTAELSASGFAGAGLPIGGLGLVLVGGGFLVVTRRRRSTKAAA